MDGSATVIRTFNALYDAEDEVTTGFLLAALYVTAVTQDDTPRNVLDSLFKALPSDSTWPALRDALLTAMWNENGGTAP